MTPDTSETPADVSASEAGERLRLVIDDSTAERLRAAAERHHATVEALMADLLRVASHRVDDILAMGHDIAPAKDPRPNV